MVLFQPRAEDNRALDSGLFFRTIYAGPIDGCGPPLSPPPEIPPPELHVFSHFARACISISPPLASSPSVFRLFVFPPVAPVVTRRPPELTGGRCQAAPVVLSKCPDDDVGVLPPQPVRLAVLGLGVGGGA